MHAMSDRSEDIFETMARLKGAGQAFALATVVRTEDLTSAKPGAKALIRGDGSLQGWVGGGCTLGAVKRAAAAALGDGRARLIRVRPKALLEAERAEAGVELHGSACPSGGTVELFVEPILPRPMLFVIGASPVGRALAALAKGSGFALTFLAPAEDQDLVAEADRRVEGFDLAGGAGLGDGAVVVATQGKGDREALAAALASGAPYVAFVGSRRKAETLKAAMRERGLPEDRVEALHAPAGLDIGAATPQEIALAILAEIVQARRRPPEAPPEAAVELTEDAEGSVETRVVSPLLGSCRSEGEAEET